MIENALVSKNVGLKTKITVKALVSVLIVALSVALPQLVHLFAGSSGGATWLPMYLPVLLGGFMLGSVWGIGVAILAPVTSFLITSATGNAMPALSRLPFMIAELSVFAAVSGGFSKLVCKNVWLSFPAVLAAECLGRFTFLGLAAAFGKFFNLTASVAIMQIKTSVNGLIAQLILVPVIVILLSLVIKNNK